MILFYGGSLDNIVHNIDTKGITKTVKKPYFHACMETGYEIYTSTEEVDEYGREIFELTTEKIDFNDCKSCQEFLNKPVILYHNCVCGICDQRFDDMYDYDGYDYWD